MHSTLHFAATHWNSAIEILLLTLGVYYTWLYLKGTGGAKVLTGLVFFLVGLTFISEILSLEVIQWLLSRFSVFFFIAIIVLFQPELRRALAQIGSKPFFGGVQKNIEFIKELSDCVFTMAGKSQGALIAIEGSIGVRGYAESGVEIDCAFSNELMQTLFFPKSPLHDGGVIIRANRIIAASCIFPVSQKESLNRAFGLRHRAALGLSEETDAICIVVSEETGSVSLCYKGKVNRGLTLEQFEKQMERLLRQKISVLPVEEAFAPEHQKIAS